MHEMGSWAWAYMAILVLVIVVAGIFVIRWTLSRPEEEEAALEILKKRYARGEISKKEFEDMKKDII